MSVACVSMQADAIGLSTMRFFLLHSCTWGAFSWEVWIFFYLKIKISDFPATKLNRFSRRILLNDGKSIKSIIEILFSQIQKHPEYTAEYRWSVALRLPFFKQWDTESTQCDAIASNLQMSAHTCNPLIPCTVAIIREPWKFIYGIYRECAWASSCGQENS